ncbi:Methyltransferase domain-containing protein [Catalinimonas alkaloidigena]|uniref:Methyltransferase domain-containing protein n=1 Tax=Catalinimonas alkaloidigena TaxID=1075417 RepID=A0A1G8WT91_9BACT|nr:methyltransferase domain-containing protein [Catalinimonas alkaloidigena]SDJ81353.1 Methyltransferase domain-containing protein [Catalinimonas alkaloidigena]
MALENEFPILQRFPKKRPPLPPPYQAIYAQHYLDNREGNTKATSVSQQLERWLHRKVAEDLKGQKRNFATLEIGAGTLNQIPYEANSFPYDVIEPFHSLYEHSPYQHEVRHFYDDIREVPADARYDRITAVATFEHITDLPTVVAKAALLLASQGSLRISIPNEGTWLWRLGTQVTGYEFTQKHGLDYQVLMRHEHVNTAAEIEEVIGVFFTRQRSASFGLNRHTAFYRFIEATQPNLERARAFLATQP